MSGRFDQIKSAFGGFVTHQTKKSLLGKTEDGIEPRSDAVARVRALNGGDASNCSMVAELYESEDDCDRGGVIVVCRNDASGEMGFCPHSGNLPNGFELHLCGDEECESMVRSLVQVFLKSRRLRKVVLSEAFKAMKANILKALTEEEDGEIWWK